MKRWQPITEDQFTRAEERLRNPRPGSKIEAAQRYGVDLNSLIENLRLTPAERVSKMQEGALKPNDEMGSRLELESFMEAVESD